MIAALNSQNVGATSLLSAATGARATPGIAKSSPAAVSAISPQAEMLAKLSALKVTDPEQFQATMSQMEAGLRAAAKDQGGAAAQHLNGLADKVAEAAKTGDLSLLQLDANGPSGKPAGGRPAGGPPPGGAPPGGGPPPGGGGAGAGASKSSTESEDTNEPADTNGDGTVSAAEEAIYALTHSAKATESGTASTAASSGEGTRY